VVHVDGLAKRLGLGQRLCLGEEPNGNERGAPTDVVDGEVAALRIPTEDSDYFLIAFPYHPEKQTQY
jgi:hypothetical protein